MHRQADLATALLIVLLIPLGHFLVLRCLACEAVEHQKMAQWNEQDDQQGGGKIRLAVHGLGKVAG